MLSNLALIKSENKIICLLHLCTMSTTIEIMKTFYSFFSTTFKKQTSAYNPNKTIKRRKKVQSRLLFMNPAAVVKWINFETHCGQWHLLRNPINVKILRSRETKTVIF